MKDLLPAAAAVADSAARVEQLLTVDFFSGIDGGQRAGLMESVDLVELGVGERLFEPGESCMALMVVVSGEIDLELPSHADTCWFYLQTRSRGQTLGDFAFLNRSRYLVRAVARAPAVIARVPQAVVDLLGTQRPGLLCDIYDTAAILSRHVMLAQLYLELFPHLSAQRMSALLAHTSVERLSAGDVVFEEGSASDDLYLIVSGRLVLECTTSDGLLKRIGEFRGPDIVGELGLLSGEPRVASLLAARASVVARLPRSGFEQIVLLDAELVTSLTRRLIRRLAPRRNWSDSDHGEVSPRTFAVVLPDADLPCTEELEQLAAAMADFSNPLLLWPERFDELFGVAGASATELDDLFDLPIARWLDDKETLHDAVIYVGHPASQAWTERIVNRADRILLLADGAADAEPVRLIAQDLRRRFGQARLMPRMELVLLHAASTRQPQGTAHWLDLLQPDGHHHVRRGDPVHIGRLARRLAGKARGLVLSSGGARGYAHLGVQRLFEERGVSLDDIGGTSMGALLAAAMAMGHDHATVVELSERYASRRALFDYTLPVVSVMRSGKLTSFCREVCGEIRIEDLWMPYFAVSANLGDGRPRVHDRGPLWHAVRASISLPGLFSPVPADDGSLLIDGAVLNGFPVDLMRARIGAFGELIGVNVSRLPEAMPHGRFGTELSGWRVMLSVLSPFHDRIAAPRVIETLLRSTDIKDVERNAEQRAAPDMLIEPDVGGWAMLDFEQFKAISDVGYEAARAVLDARIAASAATPV